MRGKVTRLDDGARICSEDSKPSGLGRVRRGRLEVGPWGGGGGDREVEIGWEAEWYNEKEGEGQRWGNNAHIYQIHSSYMGAIHGIPEQF